MGSGDARQWGSQHRRCDELVPVMGNTSSGTVGNWGKQPGVSLHTFSAEGEGSWVVERSCLCLAWGCSRCDNCLVYLVYPLHGWASRWSWEQEEALCSQECLQQPHAIVDKRADFEARLPVADSWLYHLQTAGPWGSRRDKRPQLVTRAGDGTWGHEGEQQRSLHCATVFI